MRQFARILFSASIALTSVAVRAQSQIPPVYVFAHVGSPEDFACGLRDYLATIAVAQGLAAHRVAIAAHPQGEGGRALALYIEMNAQRMRGSDGNFLPTCLAHASLNLVDPTIVIDNRTGIRRLASSFDCGTPEILSWTRAALQDRINAALQSALDECLLRFAGTQKQHSRRR